MMMVMVMVMVMMMINHLATQIANESIVCSARHFGIDLSILKQVFLYIEKHTFVYALAIEIKRTWKF